MMRYGIFLTLLAVAATPAWAGLLIGNNPNVSEGGLNVGTQGQIVPAGAWTEVRTDTNAWTVTTLRNDRNGPDQGDWDVGGSQGNVYSGTVDRYWYQRFTVAGGHVQAGSNNIQFAGWSKAWAGWWGGENFGWVQEAHVELWVDGVKVFDGLSSNNTNRDQWAFHEYSGTVNVTDNVEVRLHTVKGNDDSGAGTRGAIFWNSRYDDIRLFVCPTGSPECCPNPMTVTSVTPDSYIIPPALGAAETVTVTGTNLTFVQAAQLTGPATINGTIVTQTDTQLELAFDLSAAPTGTYNLNLDRDNSGNCPDVIKTNAITIQCATANAFVATIQNDRGLHGNPAHKIRLTGQNLSGISIVRLRKSNFRTGVPNIDATNLTMVGDDLEATFDLTNAEGGRWDVVFKMNSTCATVTPGSYNKSFLVYMPEVTNASFEEGYISPDPYAPDCPHSDDNPKAKHWDDMSAGPKYGGGHRRDGHVFGPECVNGMPKNVTGEHFDGSDFSTNGVSTWTLFQTIAAPEVDAQAISTAAFNIRADLAANGGTAFEPVTMKIRLIDGTENHIEQVLAETILPSEFDLNGDEGFVVKPEYNAVVPMGTQYLSDPPILTIAFEFTTSGSGINTFYGFWVDNVRSGPFVPPSCLGRTIWADGNDDAAVDMLDFAVLQACLTAGAAGPQALSPDCACFDRDFNEEIGEPDVVEFIKCATGPAIPWSAASAPLCVP